VTSHPLTLDMQDLRAGLGEVWDADDAMDDAYVASLPEGQFVMAAHAFDPTVVCWLTYFVARRALPCWELGSDDPRPRGIVEALGQHLGQGVAVEWSDAVRAAKSPFDDCRYTASQSASDAVAEAARYIRQRDPLHAIYCISAGDTAYDHELVEDRFRDWLMEVAIPAALEKREMTAAEQEALRGGG
jgi:hypothetical protein